MTVLLECLEPSCSVIWTRTEVSGLKCVWPGSWGFWVEHIQNTTGVCYKFLQDTSETRVVCAYLESCTTHPQGLWDALLNWNPKALFWELAALNNMEHFYAYICLNCTLNFRWAEEPRQLNCFWGGRGQAQKSAEVTHLQQSSYFYPWKTLPKHLMADTRSLVIWLRLPVLELWTLVFQLGM